MKLADKEFCRGGLTPRKSLALLHSDPHNLSLLSDKTMWCGSFTDRIHASRSAMSLIESGELTPDKGTWTSRQTVTAGPDRLI